MWQPVSGDKAGPVVIARAGNGKKTSPVADRRKAGGMLADVAFIVSVDEIFRRNLPARYCRFELVPICDAVDGERCEVACGPRFASHPSQGECSFAVFPEHGAVTREFQIDFLGWRAFDQEHLSP